MVHYKFCLMWRKQHMGCFENCSIVNLRNKMTGQLHARMNKNPHQFECTSLNNQKKHPQNNHFLHCIENVETCVLFCGLGFIYVGLHEEIQDENGSKCLVSKLTLIALAESCNGCLYHNLLPLSRN